MATEPDTALTKSEGTGKSPGGTPAGVWLLVLVLAGLAFYAGYMALHHRQLHADSEMVRKALASDKDRLEASVASLKEEIKKSKKANASSQAVAEKFRAKVLGATTKLNQLEAGIAEAVASAKEREKKILSLQSALKAAEEAKAKIMSENESLKGQIAEAQIKLDAAVSDLTGASQKGEETPALSPLPEPSYP